MTTPTRKPETKGEAPPGGAPTAPNRANLAAPQDRPLPTFGTAALARRAWPWLPLPTLPGAVYVGPTGETLRANADGTLDELGAVPARRSIAADPCASRRAP